MRLSLALAALLVALLVLPVVALLVAASPTELMTATRHPLFAPALWLSAWTSVSALAIVVALGTPLAWWLARTEHSGARVVEAMVQLPVIVPPAVVGLGLLLAFGREGWLSALSLPFTRVAVVLAQVVVAAPFYVLGAANAFREVRSDQLLVARTLGASPGRAFRTIALPVALPGIGAAAAIAWARALGEFGATLLFAGSLAGTTQTMPLAIYAALEADVRVAIALAIVSAAIAVVVLIGVRAAPRFWSRRR